MPNSTSEQAPAIVFDAPLTSWQRRGLFALLATVLVFGVFVEMRSAFMNRRMTDLGVYLRAAWAVRAGEDIYDVVDENQWHYQYPPLFAILLTPLADPPPGADRAGYLPFAVSAALWYLFNVACLAFGVHLLASLLEEDQPRAFPTGGARWWGLRVLPVLVCLIPTGQSLMRGQVNTLLLVLLGSMAADLHRRHNFRAGCWLAAAISLKVIPVFLLLIPLWHRNLRCLAGCAFGLFVGLVLLPLAVFGPTRTLDYYRAYDHKVLRPGMGDNRDNSRAKELMEVTATDSQSFLAILHNALHLDRDRRPPHASTLVRRLHWLIGGLLTACSLLAAGLHPPRSARALVLFLATLTLNMLLLSPVCHLHYLSLSIPLVMGLLTTDALEQQPSLFSPLAALFLVNFATGLIPVLPGCELTRDLGLAAYGTLALWLAGCSLLWKLQHACPHSPLTLHADRVAVHFTRSHTAQSSATRHASHPAESEALDQE